MIKQNTSKELRNWSRAGEKLNSCGVGTLSACSLSRANIQGRGPNLSPVIGTVLVEPLAQLLCGESMELLLLLIVHLHLGQRAILLHDVRRHGKPAEL